MLNEDRFAAGTAARRRVLGDEYVNRSLASASEFGRPLQELVTEYCWGWLWNRDGLPDRVRSLINLGMLAALGREHELRLHVAGALRNGCTKEEIQEALLHAGIYAGVPAAVSAFRIAQDVIADHDHPTHS
ncbi:carboxymuconolactone decarboxylase family protein [Micromonospora cremea]|uniref:4-carboxymuconolactone decarboxylase n=1 Tax=Micromonospora cremea TaxID=709881 RepID=A0A1N5VIJ2_9ACTN|nr:carboxymuconolactone decarboxylase family protein [Micromonospora cremea]SIM72528.1 4-carboxymuconolactone decarboxylase [Micromonospora cremea]